MVNALLLNHSRVTGRQYQCQCLTALCFCASWPGISPNPTGVICPTTSLEPATVFRTPCEQDTAFVVTLPKHRFHGTDKLDLKKTAILPVYSLISFLPLGIQGPIELRTPQSTGFLPPVAIQAQSAKARLPTQLWVFCAPSIHPAPSTFV